MAQTIKLKRSGTQNAVPSTSQLALGEVALNTYDGKMYIKKSVGGTESIVEIGGDATSSSGLDFTGNLNLEDNVRIVIGDGNDLQIYHDGSDSIINENGVGDLKVFSSRFRVISPAGEEMIRATADGAVDLYHNNSAKFATTSSGISVTGDISLSGNIVDSDQNEIINIDTNDIRFNGKHVQSAYGVWIRGENSASNNRKAGIDGSSSGTTLQFYTQSAERMRMDVDGRLLIGTTSSIDNLSQLHIVGPTSGRAGITLQDGDSTTQKTFFTQDAGTTRFSTQNGTSYGTFAISGWNGTTSADFVRVTSAGRVGIGTTGPSNPLHVSFSGDSGAQIQSTDNHSSVYINAASGYGSYLRFQENNDSKYWINAATDGSLRFRPAGGSSNWVVFSSTGQVGIGTTSPSEELEVSGDAKVTNLGINAGAQDYLSSLNARLTVGGNAVINTNSPILYLRANGSSNDSDLRFQNGLKFTNGGGAVQAVIASSGKVGIGTTSPGQRLSVHGASNIFAGDSSLHHNTEFSWLKSNTGSSGANIWYKVADITLPSVGYSAISMEIYYETGLNNYGNHDYLDTREVFCTITRNSGSTANNSPDSATLKGRTQDIRVYKTSAGTYELQARHGSLNAAYAVRVRVFKAASTATIVPELDGSTAGTTSGGTEYTVTSAETGNDGIKHFVGQLDAQRLHLGNVDLFPSGNLNYVHVAGSGIIPQTTTASSNASLGTSTYLWNGVFSRKLTVEDGTEGAPAITFLNDTNTGICRTTSDQLRIVTGGTWRAYFETSGIHSSANVYTASDGDFRNYGGEWHATTGTSGNGFKFTNTADSVDALTISAAGNGTFAGSLTVNGNIDLNGSDINDINQINGIGASGWLDFNMDTDSVYPQSTSDNQTVLGSVTHMNFVGDSNGNGTGGRFNWGYGVSSTDSGTFTKTMDLDRSGNLTLIGSLKGPATFTIDPAAHGDDTGTVVIAGNLQVDGTTTTINSTTLTVDDKNITLASGSTNAAAANGAGITVDCGSGTDATFTYVSATDDWKFDKPTRVSGLTNAGIAFSSTETLVDGSSALPNGRIFYHSSRLIYDSPSSGHRFAVAGNQSTNLALEIYSNRDIGFYNSSGAADLLWDASTSRLGIGTTSPGHLLHVTGADGSIANMVVNNDNVALRMSAYTNSHGEIRVETNHPLVIKTNGNNERMRINASGNVGIGTTSPSYKLDVNGTFRTTGNGYFDGSNINFTAAGANIKFNGGGGYISTTTAHALRLQTNNTEALRLTSGQDAVFAGTISSGAITSSTGTVGTSPNTFKIITSTEANTAQGDVYAALEFHVTGAENSTGTLSDSVISAIKAIDYRSGTTSFEDAGLGFYTVASADSAPVFRGGFANAGGLFLSVDGNVDRNTGAGDLYADSNIEAANNLTFNNQFKKGSDVIINNSSELLINTVNVTDSDFVVLDNNNTGEINIIWRDHSADRLYLGTDTDVVEFRGNVNFQPGNTLSHNGNVVLDASRNLTNIGTISSGMVQTTGSRVAIGNTSHTPNSTVDIKASSPAIRITDTAGGSRVTLENNAGTFKINKVGNELVQIFTNGNERFSVETSGAIRFNDAFTFPTTDGSANQVLKTDGSGNVTWATEAAVSANASISDADGDTKIQVEESADEDKIRFDAAGVERFRIGSDVQVIGTTDFNVTGANRRISFTSGTGTVQTTGASSLHLGTNNTNRVTINSSGNVGIGTTTPSQKLQVAGTILADTALAASSGDTAIGIGSESNISDGNSTYRTKLITQNNNAKLTTYQYGSYLTLKAGVNGSGYANNWSKIELRDGGGTGSNNAHMKFYTHGDERMVINNGGNVGIGTTSPNNKLTVTGAGDGINLTGSGAYLRWNSGDMMIKNEGSYRMGFYTYNSSDAALNRRMVIDTNGNVGIGTTTPDEFSIGSTYKYLAVGGDKPGIINLVDSGTSGSYLQFGTAAGVRRASIHTDSGSSDLAFTLNSSNSGTSLTERFRIKASNGYVGIGTNNPIQRLQVAGSIYANGGNIYIDSGNRLVWGNSQQFIEATNSGPMQFGTGNAERMRIETGGNVGIGTSSPAGVLDVTGTYGDFKVGDPSVGSRLTYYGTTRVLLDSNNIMFYTNGLTERMRIASSGNVGIGTASPSSKLHVQGSLSSSTGNATSQVQMRDRAVFSVKPVTNNSGTLHFAQVDSGNSIGMQFTNSAATANWDLSLQPFAGNVGIGNTSPTSYGTTYRVLHIGDAGTAGLLKLGTGASTNGPEMYSPANGKLYINTDSNTNVINLVGSNVGIGTTSPTNTDYGSVVPKLHVRQSNTTGAFNLVARFEAGNDAEATGGAILINHSNDRGMLIEGGRDGSGAASNDDAVGHLGVVTSGGSHTRMVTLRQNMVGASSVYNVGIGTTSPQAKLQVEALGIDTTTTTTTATTQVAIDTMAAATFRSAKYTIQVTNSTDSSYHITEILLIHDGTTPGITEYGTVFTGSAAEATFDADISSGNVRLLATPASTDSMTFKVVRHCITV